MSLPATSTTDNKTIFFLGGLPRSGTTLIGSLLNQNPEVYCSEHSDLLQILYTIHNTVPSLESYVAGLRPFAYKNLLKNITNSFYSDINKPFIVDKNSAWGAPYNLELASNITKDIKIIFPVRPILEVLASFVLLARKNPESNFIDRHMRNNDFWAYHYLSIDDARCEWLMRAGGEIDKFLLSLSQAKINPTFFHILKYDDLVSDTQKAMNDIYNFLGIKSHNHNFSNITVNEIANDYRTYGIKELHKVNKIIVKSSTDPSKVLSNYALRKWSQSTSFMDGYI